MSAIKHKKYTLQLIWRKSRRRVPQPPTAEIRIIWQDGSEEQHVLLTEYGDKITAPLTAAEEMLRVDVSLKQGNNPFIADKLLSSWRNEYGPDRYRARGDATIAHELEFVDRFLAFMKDKYPRAVTARDISPGHASAFQLALKTGKRRHCAPGGKKVDGKIQHVWVESVDDVKATTVNRMTDGVRAFFEWLTKAPRGVITLNPFAHLEHLPPEENEPRAFPWHYVEVLRDTFTGGRVDAIGRRVKNFQRGELYALIALLLSRSAMRVEEMGALRACDVVFGEKNQLKIRNYPGRVTKTRAERTVPMHADLVEPLRAFLKASRPTDMPVVNYKDTSLVFITRKGLSVEGAFGDALDECCRYAGLAHLTANQFRPTAITKLLENTPPHIVQKIAGHKDIRTTLKFYGKATEEAMELAIAGMGVMTNNMASPKAPVVNMQKYREKV